MRKVLLILAALVFSAAAAHAAANFTAVGRIGAVEYLPGDAVTFRLFWFEGDASFSAKVFCVKGCRPVVDSLSYEFIGHAVPVSDRSFEVTGAVRGFLVNPGTRNEASGTVLQATAVFPVS